MSDGATYRDLLVAFVAGHEVRTRKGRPWPRNKSTLAAARSMIKRIAMDEPPRPPVVVPPKPWEEDR